MDNLFSMWTSKESKIGVRGHETLDRKAGIMAKVATNGQNHQLILDLFSIFEMC